MVRARPEPGAAWIDHVWFADAGSPEARAAQAALNERRRARNARLLAWMEVNERGALWHSFDARWNSGVRLGLERGEELL